MISHKVLRNQVFSSKYKSKPFKLVTCLLVLLGPDMPHQGGTYIYMLHKKFHNKVFLRLSFMNIL